MNVEQCEIKKLSRKPVNLDRSNKPQCLGGDAPAILIPECVEVSLMTACVMSGVTDDSLCHEWCH